MRRKPSIQGANQAADRAARPRKLARRGEDQAEMRRVRDGRRPMQLDEVGNVLRDDRASLRGREGEHVAVREPTHTRTLANRQRIVAAIAKLASDLRGEVLVQQDLHRRMARSRLEAACSRSAMTA